MFDELNAQVFDFNDKQRRKQKLLTMLNESKEEFKKLKQKKVELYNILSQEEDDVKKLEGFTLESLFYLVIGNKEKKLDKERKEFFAAKLKYDDCCNSLELQRKAILSIEDDLKSYSNLESEFQFFLTQKEECMKNDNKNNSQRIIETSKKASDIASDIKEIQEAIDAGEIAFRSLNEILINLENSKKIFKESNDLKYEFAMETKSAATNAKKDLMSFKRELLDVNRVFDTNEFDNFIDSFIDSLIIDMEYQKVNDSINQVFRVFKRTEGIIFELKRKLKDSAILLDKQNIVIRKLIESQK